MCLDEVSFLVRAVRLACAREDPPPWLVKKRKSDRGRPKKSFIFDWRWATATAAVSLAVILFAGFCRAISRPQIRQLSRQACLAPEPASSCAPIDAVRLSSRNPNAFAQSNRERAANSKARCNSDNAQRRSGKRSAESTLTTRWLRF
jgi:hypothetical protein